MDDERDGAEVESVGAEEKEEKSISADLIRGHINTIILRALYDGDKYGYEIIAEIERKSHGQYSLKQPSLYSALKRLEKDGYVTSYWGGSVAGGRRKYFSLTDEGRSISEQNQSEWEYSRTVIDSLISDKDFDFNNPAPTLVNMRVLRNSTSRVPRTEGEDDELDYEPVYDDTLDVQRLQAEFDEKNAALAAREAELDERARALDAEKASMEEQAVNVQNAELEEKVAALESDKAALEAEKADLEAEKARFEEEKKSIEEEKERLEQLRAEQERGAEEDALAREAEQSDREERLRATAEEEAERRRRLDEEEAMRKSVLAAEEEARRNALTAEENARRKAIEDEEAARRAKLEAEEAERRARLEAEETSRREALSRQEELKREADARHAEEIRVREQELSERDAFYTEERKRFAELLRQRDEQIEAERRAHANDLAAQEQRILREQEALFRERERELLHRNYLELVSTPPAPAAPAQPYFEPTPAPAPAAPVKAPEEDYRRVVNRIYAGTVERETPPVEARSIDGIDFSDLRSRAQYDGIKITTTGTKPAKRTDEEPEETVHKGKALFLSALVVFCLCVIEGGILLAVQSRYALPVYYPYLVWAIGVALLLITGLAYANHWGKRSIRRTAPIMVNALVLYALAVIITLIVALAVKIDFTSASAIATFIVVPIVFFFGIVVFGICYYLLTKPTSKKK